MNWTSYQLLIMLLILYIFYTNFIFFKSSGQKREHFKLQVSHFIDTWNLSKRIFFSKIKTNRKRIVRSDGLHAGAVELENHLVVLIHSLLDVFWKTGDEHLKFDLLKLYFPNSAFSKKKIKWPCSWNPGCRWSDHSDRTPGGGARAWILSREPAALASSSPDGPRFSAIFEIIF